MALSSLTSAFVVTVRWNAQLNLVGGGYSPIGNAGSLTYTANVGTSVADAVTGGGDQFFSFQQGIVAGASATIDLQNMTNIINQSAIALARIKAYHVRLLSAADDATISPAPTATSTVTVSNLQSATPSPLDFASNGSGLTIALTVGATIITGVTIGAAGTGYPPSSSFVVVPVQAGSSGGVISVTTNGSGVPTSVAVVAGGTGYTAATVPTVVGGMYTVYTGGSHLYMDPRAAGFCLVSSTQKKFLITNNDASNAVTVEIDVVGGGS